MNGQVRHRSTIGRVAVPVEASPSAPASLVPSDVWESWQRELQSAPDDGGAPIELDERDFEIEAEPGAGHPIGLAATTPADFEVALFALGHVRLFEGLDRPVLELLAHAARQGELSSGDYLFREEGQAESFYVILDGALEVLRRADGREVALRHLDRTEPVGLFGVLSGQRRAACVRAIGDAVLLELPASALAEAIATDPGFRERVARFFQERLLEGFVGSSRLFSDVDSIARARLIGRFAARRLEPGETLVQPGEVSNLLAVVISGRLLLESRPTPGALPERFDLIPGEFLALTSAFSGAPCRMRVHADASTVLAVLGQRELAELLRDTPALRAINLRLPQVARALVRDVWCGHCAVPGL